MHLLMQVDGMLIDRWHDLRLHEDLCVMVPRDVNDFASCLVQIPKRLDYTPIAGFHLIVKLSALRFFDRVKSTCLVTADKHEIERACLLASAEFVKVLPVLMHIRAKQDPQV